MAQSILIVDDEKEIVSMLYCYFSKLGYTVYTATAGNAALKEVEKKPDIILLDVNMPDIDGFTVCERIRDYVSCPIIFLTARIEDSDKIKGFSIGADDYVIKPFSVDELEARIAAHLRREKRHNISSKVQFDEDRLIDSALGSLNIAIIPIVLSISMICCVTFFYKKKLSKPIKLLTNAYHKIEANDLDFTLSYPLNDEMGKLCHAFEKMKDCLSKNNETMFRQFAEQRRLNAAFSHDLRTPLTLLKGHATMLLSFIPKGLVSQQEILDEISVMSKNISRLEKYVNAMTNLYRLEDIDIPRQQITFHSLIDNFNNTAEALCYDKHFSITTSGNNITLFINLDTVMQIYENLLSNSIRYAKSDIAISVVIENDNLVISVSDDGCGFKNIDIEKATLPFYKSSKDIATEHLGLGLNISKILSERHGGNIQIANNKAGGACVTVKINCNES